jgi:tight adherence protein B
MTESLITTLITATVGGLGFAVFVGVRYAHDWRRSRQFSQLQNHPESLETLFAMQLPESADRPPGWDDRVDRYFDRLFAKTGLPLDAAQSVGLMGLCGVGLAALLYIWRESEALAGGGMVLGLIASWIGFKIAKNRFRQKLQGQLPDAFYFLARSLRAGLSFEQALSLVASESPAPLADELKRCNEHIKLGLTVPAALQLTAPRVDLPDFNVFVALITLHRTIGGNLTLLLDRLAASVRDRNQYAGFFRSATALGRASAIAVGLAVPAIFIGYLLFEPDYALRFFQSENGLIMLGFAAGLEVIGAVWLYYLLKVDY